MIGFVHCATTLHAACSPDWHLSVPLIKQGDEGMAAESALEEQRGEVSNGNLLHRALYTHAALPATNGSDHGV